MARLLPSLSLSPAALARQEKLHSYFPSPVSAIWLEIGFGGGEHLAEQAKANPHIGLIGCEPFVNGVAKLVSRIAQEGLGNIRLYDGDARDLLPYLPQGSIAKIFLLFPDPWPKARHAKRRLVNDETLKSLARLAAGGGELRIATDSASYCRHILEKMRGSAFEWLARSPGDWRSRPQDWPPTRYEAKALKAGRSCYYLCFRRRTGLRA
jgi:tRNA (guanine-N7-)-methyltransferase